MKKAFSASGPAAACPCGSGAAYAACCGRIHGGMPAPTAVQLMRARYSAYVARDDAFILASWHASTRPSALEPEQDPATRWLGLDVRHRTEQGDTATVEFVARYKVGGRAHRLHEVSSFVREAGAWWYVDGSFTKEEKR